MGWVAGDKMATGYTRQSAGSITDGATIQASHFNNEYNQLESAFNASTGHDHSGGAGLGPTIALSGGAIGITGTLAVGNGGIGATTLTDGGILLGSGTSAVTAMGVLADGSVVVGDGATDPVAITCFTSSTGLLIHERGGLEVDVSAIADGGMVVGTGAGTMAIRTGVLTAGAAGFLTHEVGGIEANISAITTDQFLGGTSSGVIEIRTAAQVRTSLALVIGTNTQAWDANLDQIAALAPTADNFIAGNGSAWILKTPATARTSLGLVIGTDVQTQDVVLDDLAALSAVADNEVIVGTGAGTYAHESGNTLRTSIGLAIGTDVQAEDAVLTDLAALSAVADNEFIVGTGAGTYAHENASTARGSMGLGSIATQAANSVSISGGTVTGITDITIADGGTGSSTASTAFTALKQIATESATGVAEIATQAETDTGTDDVRYVTPLKLATMIGNLPTPDFLSSDQTVATNTRLEVAHSLGATPTLVQLVLKCTTGDLNYSVGDEVVMHTTTPATANAGIVVFSDTTNVTIVQGDSIEMLGHDTSFSSASITVGSWRWVIKAWA